MHCVVQTLLGISPGIYTHSVSVLSSVSAALVGRCSVAASEQEQAHGRSINSFVCRRWATSEVLCLVCVTYSCPGLFAACIPTTPSYCCLFVPMLFPLSRAPIQQIACLPMHACLKSSSIGPDCIGLPLQPGAKLEEEEAKRIFQQVLSAMDYCHRR